MDLAACCRRLDDRLRIDDFADLDASPNGLQVGPDEATVEHAAFAVDAAVETIGRAADAGADLLVTHHGLVWGEIERVTGTHYRRVAPLVEADLALYVAHLPLDAHQDLGNAAGVADVLGLRDRQPFGSLGPEHVGQRGRLDDPLSPEDLRDRLDESLSPRNPVRLLDVGPEAIDDVAIVTGSGVDWIDEAAAAGADVLVTGEGKQQAYHEAKEAGLNVVLAGHYATETFGVRSLRDQAEGWGLETTFVDAPTGL